MKITREEIVERLCDCGYDTYIVGGAVRDLLRGVPADDEDVVTAALPEEVEKIFEGHNIKTVGKSFKVVMVDGIEVATFRTDRYTGLSDKQVEVQVAGDILEDLKRRDLTINAAAFCQYTGDVVDPYHGREDLQKRVIRFVGSPEKRIFEDPNRMIRACRFKALINGTFEEKTKEALIYFAHLIPDFVDPERINKEIMKTITRIKKSSRFFHALYEIGALEYIFPSLDDCYAYKDHGRWHEESVIDHSYICGDNLPIRKPLLKLAGYLHDVGKPGACSWNPKTNDLHFHRHAEKGADCLNVELKHLRFSNKEIKYITTLTGKHMRNFKTPRATRRTLQMLNEHEISWKEFLQLKMSDSLANSTKGGYPKEKINKIVHNIMFEIKRKSPNKFGDLAINGKHIMEVTGLKPGPEIGKIKTILLDLVILNPDWNDFDLLTQIAVILKENI